ncbi:MAG: carboxypeptidase-like regulatory domain-containing protein [Nitrospirota bacterium]
MKVIFSVLMMMLVISCSAAAYGATFKGKVIDADTGQPIEGAVVVASWMEETTTLGGTHTRLKEVKETLTDKNGEWMIDGPKGREGGNITAVFTLLTGTYYTRTPEFIIFKPGYCLWPASFTIDSCKEKMKPNGNDKIADGVTVELPQLVKREDRVSVLPTYISGDSKDKNQIIRKQKEFINLINEERRNLGFTEYKTLKELQNEKH